MSNLNIENLPPELQARLTAIVAQGQAAAAAAPAAPTPPALGQPAAPAVRPPSLMDHVIAMRQDIAELQASINAMAQVTDAVGNAVGQLYSMFHEQTQPTSFSTTFQTQNVPQQPVETDY